MGSLPFVEEFGKIDYPVLCYVTEKNDTLLIYKLMQGNMFSQILVTDIKDGKAYFISRDSKQWFGQF